MDSAAAQLEDNTGAGEKSPKRVSREDMYAEVWRIR